MKHKVIGQGTYGCIHKESLRCHDNTLNKENMVSKVLLKENALSEMESNLLIHTIDKKNEFHLGRPKMCTIKESRANAMAISECDASKHINNKDITQNRLILMNDGGINLDHFAEKLIDLSSTNKTNFHKMERFWIEVHRLFRGIECFLRSDFIHHDLKPQNILYNEKLNRLNFIDFGLSDTLSNIRKSSIKSKNRNGSEWWSYPPEYKYINKTKFTFAVKEIDTNHYNKILQLLSTRVRSDLTYHLKGFLPYVSYWKHQYLIDLEWLYSTGLDNYETLLTCCLRTFDIYGVGFSLLQVLESTKHVTNDRLWNELSNLLYLTITPNYMKRITIHDLLNRYEELLEKNGLLRKYNLLLEDHQLFRM